MKDIILSGMQPTGELHIGNYLGALKNFVSLQNDYQCYFFIASLHSLTIPYEAKEKRQQIRNLAKAYIAAGISPKKSVIFDQTDVPEHLELYWILNTLTPIPEAERMTQFKDKSEKHRESVNIGLLTYPILQAADILIYHATKVPVGVDQVQHVELTRKCARWFNNKFGDYFQEPEPLLTNIPKVQSLANPEKKMSKSDGPNSYLGILDEPEVLQQKIKRAVTGLGTEDEIPPGAENLLNIITELGFQGVADKYRTAIATKNVRYGDMKDEVAKIIIEHFSPIREKYKKISDREIDKILTNGAKQARKVAVKTLVEVRKMTGLK